ncbi:HAD-superfamily hydrolase [Coprinopsis marcescibilis]|uniref:HAD-superfamily hydrolase n=1 Tax=Coprinopsis marcescibilis TaxID=230819 RepID=A0A5C3KFX2_COPMA|nr:HAD-superfamily hydrolase [Coprinopsis marcescibilis]
MSFANGRSSLRVISQLVSHPSSTITRRCLQTGAPTRRIPPLGFVFDIDGVLIRGPHVLPAAKQALKTLQGDNPFKTKIPYILLTNGGGVTEEERSKRLSDKLEVPIHEAQYIQAHTVIKKYAQQYAEEPVLVLGGKLDAVRKVAENYGFRKAYTSLDIHSWNPAVWPFYKLTDAERAVAKSADFSQTPISAVFVFHDPRNWALDVQILCDIVQSGGIVGGPPVPILSLSKPVKVVFCNPDLLWRSDFEQPRLGQGAFKEAFQAVFKALTGDYYPHVQYGKPSKETYDFAKDVMQRHCQEQFGVLDPALNLYMIGDNPASDIAGANQAKWDSILVKTGVYDPLHGPPAHHPTHIADDVNEAVNWAIEREYTRLLGK